MTSLTRVTSGIQPQLSPGRLSPAELRHAGEAGLRSGRTEVLGLREGAVLALRSSGAALLG